MAIENRNLEVGTRLVASYKKVQYVCTVEAAPEDDGVVFKLEDGKTFKSPSAAASAVMRGSAANGWRFWSVEGQGAAPAADAAVSAPKERKPRGKRSPATEAAPEASQPEEFEYEIDSDGRPVPESDTSAAVEADAAAEPGA